MNSGVAEAKRALRAELRGRRLMRSTSERDAAAAAIGGHLDTLLAQHGARSISCFLSTPTEPGTHEFVAGAVRRGIRVLLPISRPDGLLDWAAADGAPRAAGLFGIPEPVGAALGPAALHDVDLMIIPAAAVDRSGARLGWGRGYFDRALSSMPVRPPVYAVTYDSEVVDSLPHEVHDQPITGVVTPTGILTLLPERH